jgi:hypothetical protein
VLGAERRPRLPKALGAGALDSPPAGCAGQPSPGLVRTRWRGLRATRWFSPVSPGSGPPPEWTDSRTPAARAVCGKPRQLLSHSVPAVAAAPPGVQQTMPHLTTPGPDAVWFSEMRVYREGRLESWIGRITPGGLVSEFRARLPSREAFGDSRFDPSIYDLTVGPDGNVWFVGDSAWIGRLTPNGAVTSFPTRVVGAGSRPRSAPSPRGRTATSGSRLRATSVA